MVEVRGVFRGQGLDRPRAEGRQDIEPEKPLIGLDTRRLLLRMSMFAQIPLGQFGHRGSAALLLAGLDRVGPVQDGDKGLLGLLPGLLHGQDAVASQDHEALPAAGAVEEDESLRPGGVHPEPKAGERLIPEDVAAPAISLVGGALDGGLGELHRSSPLEPGGFESAVSQQDTANHREDYRTSTSVSQWFTDTYGTRWCHLGLVTRD